MQFRTLLFPVYIYLLNKTTTTREKIMIQDLLFFEKQLPPPARGSLGSAKRKGTLLPLKIFVSKISHWVCVALLNFEAGGSNHLPNTNTRERKIQIRYTYYILSSGKEQKERNIKGGFLRLISKSTVLLVFFIQKRIEYLSTSYLNIFDVINLFHVV